MTAPIEKDLKRVKGLGLTVNLSNSFLYSASWHANLRVLPQSSFEP